MVLRSMPMQSCRMVVESFACVCLPGFAPMCAATGATIELSQPHRVRHVGPNLGVDTLSPHRLFFTGANQGGVSFFSLIARRQRRTSDCVEL